jgi:hypothetical protein
MISTNKNISLALLMQLRPAEIAALGQEGILIRSLGRNLVLTGARSARRGTLYAGYAFLEDAASNVRSCSLLSMRPTGPLRRTSETGPN